MKNLIFLVLSNLLIAQIGVGTDNPHPSAALEISPHLNPQDETVHGVIFPRISITDEQDQTTVPNPVDGTLIYNTNTTSPLREGLYFWNDQFSIWDRGFLYGETPKTTTIRFTGTDTDYPILNGAGAGASAILGSTALPVGYIFQDNALTLGIQTVTYSSPTQGDVKCISLNEPGQYQLLLSFALNAPTCDPITRCKSLSATAPGIDFYYDGLFYDLFVLLKDAATGEYTIDQSLPGSYFGRVRKEAGIITKLNEEHVINQYFVVDVPDDGVERALYLRVGRMTGSSINDEEYLLPSASYIKINKF